MATLLIQLSARRAANTRVIRERTEKWIFLCLIAGCPDHGRGGGPALFAVRGRVLGILAAHVEVSLEMFSKRGAISPGIRSGGDNRRRFPRERKYEEETSFRELRWHLTESVSSPSGHVLLAALTHFGVKVFAFPTSVDARPRSARMIDESRRLSISRAPSNAFHRSSSSSNRDIGLLVRSNYPVPLAATRNSRALRLSSIAGERGKIEWSDGNFDDVIDGPDGTVPKSLAKRLRGRIHYPERN